MPPEISLLSVKLMLKDTDAIQTRVGSITCKSRSKAPYTLNNN